MKASLLLFAAVLAATVALADDPPYPKGESTQTFAGLKFHLHLPADYDPAEKYSLLVALHGMNASETDIASWFTELTDEGFVVCAPKSTGGGWNKPDIEKVKEIVRHLLDVLSIDPKRLHATGFSNGGMHLVFLVFDEKLPFATACWMGSGFTGGRVPKRARKEFAALALAGDRDPARGAAEKTPDLLRKKVRFAECRIQEDLGHEIPDELIPYYRYWLSVMEGRFRPGADESFPWVDDLEVGKEKIAAEKRPGFFYFFDERHPENEDAKRLEHEVFFDPLVRHFGRQLVAVKVDLEIDDEYFAELGLTKLPAIAVVKPDLTVTAKFEGKIDAKALAKALRALAKDKSIPR